MRSASTAALSWPAQSGEAYNTVSSPRQQTRFRALTMRQKARGHTLKVGMGASEGPTASSCTCAGCFTRDMSRLVHNLQRLYSFRQQEEARGSHPGSQHERHGRWRRALSRRLYRHRVLHVDRDFCLVYVPSNGAVCARVSLGVQQQPRVPPLHLRQRRQRRPRRLALQQGHSRARQCHYWLSAKSLNLFFKHSAQ